MRKIKIAHILYTVGGIEVYLDLITKNINDDLVHNIIIHNKNKDNKEYKDLSGSNIKQFFIPIQREIKFFKDLKCVYQTVLILKREKPHIIHAHSAKGGIIARLASIFCNVKVLHTPHAYSYLSTRSIVKKSLFLTIERVFRHFNSILVATSKSELLRGINEVGYNPSKAFLFNNSILPISENQINSNINFKLPDNYICTVGRPSYQKNIEMMVNVIKELKIKIPNIHLVVMGLGVVSPNTKNVKSLISKHNLENNITLIEWIEREKIFHIIRNSKFYISTSRYEGLPYSIIECLALKKAVVASNCDGNKDLVKNNYNGFLVEQDDLNTFVDKVYNLWHNQELRNTFGHNAYLRFKKNYDLSANIKILENIYTQSI